MAHIAARLQLGDHRVDERKASSRIFKRCEQLLLIFVPLDILELQLETFARLADSHLMREIVKHVYPVVAPDRLCDQHSLVQLLEFFHNFSEDNNDNW